MVTQRVAVDKIREVLKPVRVRKVSLESVSRGVLDKPYRIFLYGVEGVGKTEFAFNAPKPIFISPEDGTGHLDTNRFENVGEWQDIVDAIDVLTSDDHDYKTVVLDTADWIEPMVWDHLVATRRKENGEPAKDIEDYGYGKGYNHAIDFWRMLVAKLEYLQRVKSMNVIILAHSHVKNFKNPEGPDFERWEIAMNAKAAGVMVKWAETVLFARFEQFTDEDKKKRVRGVSTGNRVIHTQRTAAFDAKNRQGLPDTLPLDWQAFDEAAKAGRPVTADVAMGRIEKMLSTLDKGDEMRQKTANGVKWAGGDAGKLAKVADKLATMISIKNKESEDE